MGDPALSHKTEHGRFYTHPARGNDVPSITNVKDVMGVDGLKYWAANECAEYAADNVKTLATLNRDDIFALVKKAPFSRSGKKAVSSQIGDIVHDWIDQVIKGTAVADVNTDVWVNRFGDEVKPPIQAKWTWSQYAGKGDSFLNVMKPEYVMSEFTVWSETYDYAGTMDWAARVGGKRLLTLGDNKTGNKVYPDMAIQLAAGSHADYILMPDTNEENGYRKVRIPEFQMHAILHLRPRGWSLVPMYKIAEAFQAFIGLRAAFQWKVDCENDSVGMAPKYAVRLGK